MHQAVRRQRFFAREFPRRIVEARDRATRFLNQQNTSRSVPRIQIEFPERVKSASSNGRQVERSRSRTPHAVRFQRDHVVEINVGILVPLVAGKTSRAQRFAQSCSPSRRSCACRSDTRRFPFPRQTVRRAWDHRARPRPVRPYVLAAIETQNTGKPCAKFVVPSSGSIYQR